jgi:hypothetical protein
MDILVYIMELTDYRIFLCKLPFLAIFSRLLILSPPKAALIR